MSELLARLPDFAFAGMLILCRIGAAVSVLPGIGEAEPPAMLRIGLALGLSVLVAPLIAPRGVDPGLAPVELVRVVATEIAVGLFIGWLARLIVLALPIAGQLVSVFTGLSSVLQPDPALGAQSSAIARLFSLAAPVLLLASGIYALPLRALAGSYRLIPLGSRLEVGDATRDVVAMTETTFTLAAELAAPFIVIGTAWQVGIGLIARFAPSLQAGAASVPGQVLGGMLLLALLLRGMLSHWDDAAARNLMLLPGLAWNG